MSNIAERIDVSENAGLLIQQWARAPRMRALTEVLLGVVHDHLVEPMAEMERRGRIETANGMWLDCIGERLALPRPATNLGNHLFFGFQGSGGVGFDQGTFATVIEALSPRVPVGDEYYRALLLMHSLALVSNGSVPDIEKAVQRAIPGSWYEEGGGMEVSLVLPSRADTRLVEVLHSVSAWPKPAGVSLTFQYTAGMVPSKANEVARAIIRVGPDAPDTLYDGRLGSPSGSAEGDLEIAEGLVIQRIRWPAADRLLFNKGVTGTPFNTWAAGDGATKSFYIATRNRLVELRVADIDQSGSGYIRWDGTDHSDLRDELVEGTEFTLVVGDST